MHWSLGILALWLFPLILGLPVVVGAFCSKRFRAWFLAKISAPEDVDSISVDLPEPNVVEDELNEHLNEPEVKRRA